MKYISLITLALSLLVSLLLSASPVVASQSVPDFPSCTNPSGSSLKVAYDSGIHGIVGDPGVYSGSDSVYTLSDTRLIQCFCPAGSGSGIQTDWWKYSESVPAGWTFVPSGAVWGLDAAPYVARNSGYNCHEGGTEPTPTFSPPGTGGAPVCDSAKPQPPTLLSVERQGTKAILAWSLIDNATHYTILYGLKPGDYIYGVPNTGQVTSYTVDALDPGQTYYFAVKAVNNCMPSDSSSDKPVGGAVLGTASFAPTGNQVMISILLGLGSFLLVLSLAAKKYNRDR
ncbi:MAG: hypothetical protein UX91_C0006G0039 [Candidatus Amesbacteria bacterium GW2011_GWB1_47_19]|nr:MAG: hypothetical protein UW51_C0002G0039 [Candidatus Amesbacteria bacterium GW2011_GWA1_44_24]KKU31370.1 MAG: hypothetical protein UX46_C0006G0162 [Candidatus Amesbacteria bacterium GW2011_GWC1_46_24]KKU66977.1 MAG: hypothetical protein UX91_C0006G0039 [Candidatus Amesbacteria bacterium GW2011_GWB1_47_19]